MKRILSRSLAALCIFTAAGAALAAHGPQKFTSRAKDLGVSAANRTLTLTVWLKQHDTDALTAKLAAMHDEKGQAFQNWASAQSIAAQHAPTAAQASTVAGYLASRGLHVSPAAPNALFLRASGTAAQISSALKVQLHDYELNGKRFFANANKPQLPSYVASLVSHVGGLTDYGARPMIARPLDAHRQLVSANPNGLIFSASCFRAPQAVQFQSADATATYAGNRYGADIGNSAPGTIAPCGYQPSEIQGAFGLNNLYKDKLTGAGQTIAIVDAYGSTTINDDAQAFSQIMGLPPVDLTVIGTPTENNFSGDDNSGWAAETTLDVEWAHAIAPGAKILLVVAPSASFDDLLSGIATAASAPGVSVISNSWSGDEIDVAGDAEFYGGVDNFFKSISAQGIAINFSSGDSGNNADVFGFAEIGWPGSSPYATAIGGTSLALQKNGQIAWQSAWGNNITLLAEPTDTSYEPVDPPFNEGFDFGGGGGISDLYAAPQWQHIPGPQAFTRRATPDISWLADPFTGAEIIFTGDSDGDLFVEAIGGTSLACPMFSALWAITTQANGKKLGQAAPYLYNLPGDAVTDLKSLSSPSNVGGFISDSGGSEFVSPQELAAPLQGQPSFFSALYNSPFSGNWYVLTFGTNSTLQAGNGYDLATGVGSPNPSQFVQAIGHKH